MGKIIVFVCQLCASPVTLKGSLFSALFILPWGVGIGATARRFSGKGAGVFFVADDVSVHKFVEYSDLYCSEATGEVTATSASGGDCRARGGGGWSIFCRFVPLVLTLCS